MRHVLVASIMCFAGSSLAAQAVTGAPARAECPPAPLAGKHRVFPDTVYVTWVLNGKLLLRHERQVVRGPHSVVALDSLPEPFDPSEIETIEFPVGEAARRWETCPGVRVVRVRTRSESGANASPERDRLPN